MYSFKHWIESIKNDKIKAFFNEITALELILMCIPFTISLVTTRGISRNSYGFAFIALIIMIGFSLMFLIGLRWRIIYFAVLLFVSIFFILYIGKPWQYWLMADRDEAIRVGIQAILSGKNPYKARTHLGHHPTPLPFTFLFYLPLYLITLGHTSVMNIIIIGGFIIALFYRFIDTKQNYLILPIVSFIIFTDYFFLEISMQSDLISANLLLCLVLLLIPDEIPKQKTFKKFKYITFIPDKPENINQKIILFSIFFGCILAMRFHFWLIGFVVFLYMFKIYGFKNTIKLGVITICTVLIVVVPFMLQDLNYFINVSPMAQNTNKFGYLNGTIISLLIILFSILLGFTKCENKFQLLLIVALSFLILLFFYLFGPYSELLRDYVSMVAIPFVFSFLYINLENNKNIEIKAYKD